MEDDGALSLSFGGPLQSQGRDAALLNSIIVEREQGARAEDLIQSLVNEQLWSVAAAHKLAVDEQLDALAEAMPHRDLDRRRARVGVGGGFHGRLGRLWVLNLPPPR